LYYVGNTRSMDFSARISMFAVNQKKLVLIL
jgi:hypothetical protein